jgi:hypothetical protein
MFIAPHLFPNSSSGGAKYICRSSGALESLGPLRAINIALLTTLKTVSDDNPPKLMYKGKAEQTSNSLIAYARLTRIRTRFCLRL